MLQLHIMMMLTREWRSIRQVYWHWIGIQRLVWKNCQRSGILVYNGKGYFGHDNAAWHSNGSAANVEMVEG
jgi:hypothetical protein